MPTFNIALRDGFDNDDVIIFLNDAEVARRSGVTTDLTISHATSLDVSTPEGWCTLRIDIPRQGVSSSVDVNAIETPYVAVFVRHGKVEFHKLKEALPML